MPPGDAARLLHRLTSYEPGREWTTPVDDPRIRQDLEANDPATRPLPYKRYATTLPRLALPRQFTPGELSATAAPAGVAAPHAAEPDRQSVGRLLFLFFRVVRVTQNRGPRLPLRAPGSAGARFPLELYLVARGIDGIPDGVHWYHPEDHALVGVGPAPHDGSPTVVVTGVPWRTGWRYAERGYRHLYWDVGAILAQQVAVAHQLGVPAQVRTVFPDTVVSRLVGADGVQEFPLALLTLGEGDPAIGPTGDAARGRIARTLREFPLVTEAQHAGDGEELGDPVPEGYPLAGEVPDSAGL